MTVTLTTLDAQRGLTQLGFGPGPLDGIWGYQTAAAMAEYLAAQEAVFGPASIDVNPSADGRKVSISPDGYAHELKVSATKSREAYPAVVAQSTAQTPMGVPLSIPSSEPFWRFDNPLAWLVAIAGAAAGGVVFTKWTQKGRRRR